jgi:hypothetical protein
VEGFSSGEETDVEEKELEASMKDASSFLLDYNTLRIAKNLEELPKEARPGLIFTNLDDWVTPFYIKLFIEETPVFL